MKSPLLCRLSVGALASILAAAAASAQGDRGIDTNVVYPAGAFLVGSGTGGRVIDITHPPTSVTPAITAATGNGSTDDTAAFQSAFNYIKAQCVATGGKSSYILYVPNGKYRVTDTLFYTGPVAQVSFSGGTYDINDVHVVGQSRAGAVIQLDNNCTGFTSAGSPKAVLRYNHVSTTENALPSNSLCENLTINTGTGNYGAVGIQFVSANSGRMSNLSVVSQDKNGLYGIWLNIGSVQAYMDDITVQGFNSGVYCQAGLETIVPGNT